MGTSTRFWDKTAEKYARQPIEDESAYQYKLSKTQELFTPETRILELGCGTGSTALLHAPKVAHIDAHDLSPEMIRIAKDNADRARITNVNFEVKTVEDLDEEDSSYDIVMAMSLLHLLEDRHAFIEKANGFLKPGGYFVSSTAILADQSMMIRIVLPIMKFFGLAPLVKIFSTSELISDIESAGFEIDYRWRPGPGKAVFIIAKKPEPQTKD